MAIRINHESLEPVIGTQDQDAIAERRRPLGGWRGNYGDAAGMIVKAFPRGSR